MKFTVNQVGAFRFAQKSVQKSYTVQSGLGKNGNGNTGGDVAQIRQMLSASERGQDMSYSRGIISDSASYGDSLRASRMKAKSTSLNLKKIRYQYKSISTQLMRCKTSTSAKQVAAKARREVIRLKRQNQSGQSQYDDQELQGAIAHAQAIERLAKKKVRHLQEEEMAKIANGFWGEGVSETGNEKDGRGEEGSERQVTRELTIEQKTSISYEENTSAVSYTQRIEYPEDARSEAYGQAQQAGEQQVRELEEERARQMQEEQTEQLRREQEEHARQMRQAREEQARRMQEMMRQQAEQLREMMEQQAQELRRFAEETSGSLTDRMNDRMKNMMGEMSDSMKKMLEESGLSELLEDMGISVERDMEPADYKMMKIKHRAEELRDLAKADAEYLKALFGSLEKQKDAIVQGISGTGNQRAGFGAQTGGATGIGAVSGGAVQTFGTYNASAVQNQMTSQINAQFSASVSSFSVAEAFTVSGGGMDVSV